ncbi:MAG: polysaccharide biosynthesis tyrosine autokinase [Dehalococcoidia bacterium]
MDADQVISVARRWWWALLLAAVGGAAVALAVSLLLPPRYEATATLLVAQRQDAEVLQLNDLQASERLANTFSRLVVLDPVLEAAAEELGDGLDIDSLERAVAVTNPRNTQLLEVTASASTAARARDIANTVARTFIASNEQNLGSRPGTVTIVEEARAPLEPVWPRATVNVVLGVLGGLLLGSGALATLEFFDDRVREVRDLTARTGLVALGQVERFRAGPAPFDVVRASLGPGSTTAEAYRGIRTALSYALRSDTPRHTVLFTSAGPGDGKSTTIANLAVAFGLAGRRVVVVDADFRRPAQALIFDADRGAGLSELLQRGGSTEVQQAVAPTSHPNVWLLAAGAPASNPSELLGSARMEETLEALSASFDLVLVDTPPVLGPTDAAVLSELADAVVLVVRAGHTRSAAVRDAIDVVGQSRTPLVGAILNGVPRGRPAYALTPPPGVTVEGESRPLRIAGRD